MPVQNSYSGRVSSATGPDATAQSLRTLDFLWSIQFAHPLEERAVQVPGGTRCLRDMCGNKRRAGERRGQESGRAQYEDRQSTHHCSVEVGLSFGRACEKCEL